MSFAIVTYLDEASSKSIEEMWDKQAEEDISRFMLEEGYRPHITLGACEALSPEECRDDLESFAAGTEPFTVEMPYIGLFPHKNGAVFLGVTTTLQLLTYHQLFHEMFARHGRTVYDVFAPGKWAPHCSVAYHESREKDLRALQIYMEMALPIIATCDRLAVIEFPPWTERLMIPLGRQVRS